MEHSALATLSCIADGGHFLCLFVLYLEFNCRHFLSPLPFSPHLWADTVHTSAANRSIGSTAGCTITEKAPTRALSWLKAATTAFTFKMLLRHYAKRALTPQSLNVKLGPRRNYHKGRAAIRHYANQTARPL